TLLSLHALAPLYRSTLSLHDALPIYLPPGQERDPGAVHLHPAGHPGGAAADGASQEAHRRRPDPAAPGGACARRGARGADRLLRSEEHTSELQSRENLVCRLLLEKKK